MSEIGSISVSIGGDASGLLSAVASAKSAVSSLTSTVDGLIDQSMASWGLLGAGSAGGQADLYRMLYPDPRNIFYNADKRLFENYTGTANTSITEQKEWWREAMEKYAWDIEAVMECSEEIFALTRELADELNRESADYVSKHSMLNDWEKLGDSAIDAFERIRGRNSEFLEQGIITWDEYCTALSDIGAEMYEERIKQSENWLNQQYKYNGMSVEDYIAGLDRMAEYTHEYYKNGLIGEVDYFYGVQGISNKKSEMYGILGDMRDKANAEEYRAWQKSADGYKLQRSVYDDWDEWGDSLADYYKRCIERQNEFFAAGKIDWETYNDAVINYKMELYKTEKSEAENAYNALLEYAEDYISGIKASFREQMSELSYEQRVEELSSEFGKAALNRARYKNAVTQRGKDVFEAAEEKMAEIGRERDRLELEREQSEILARLSSRYKELEDSKTLVMNRILNEGIDVNNILDSIAAEFSAGQSDVCILLNELISAVKSSGGGTVYGGTTYNISGADASFVGPILQRGAAALSGYGG